MDEAGWKDTDGDGILEKGSLKAEFSLYYPANDVIRQSLAISVADMIKPLGINIKVEGGKLGCYWTEDAFRSRSYGLGKS